MRNVKILGLAALATGGSALALAMALEPKVPFGEAAEQITREDVRLDADRTLAKIDLDGNDVISVDEFASSTIVLADLGRFNGLVTIDGEALVNVPVPEEARGALSSTERVTLDAIARTQYYTLAGADNEMSMSDWTAYQMDTFETADRNHNSVLERAELDTYAYMIVRFRAAMS